MIGAEVDAVDRFAARENFGEDLERSAREGGREILQLHRKAQVGLVVAEALHRLGIGHPGKRRAHVNAKHALINRRDHALGDRLDVFRTRARHLDIDLAELGLAVRAQILVAEAAGDLIVAIESADHQDLLEQLRRLRQRVELAGVDPARHQVVARALGRRFEKDRRLDVDETVLIEVAANRLQRLVTPAQVALHLGPAQIEIAVLEADFLGGRIAVGNLERHGRGSAERLERADQYFNFAGRQLGVDGPLGAAHDLAFDRDIKLRAHVAGRLMRGGVMRGIQHQLHDSVAVAEIDEDKAAVVAARLDPSPQGNFAANVGGANSAAVISALPGRQRRI